MSGKRTGQQGITLIEVAVAGALVALAAVFAARQHFYNMRSLAYTRSADAATSVEDQLAGAVLTQMTTFYRRVAADPVPGQRCRANATLTAAGPYPAVNATTYFDQTMQAAAMTNLTINTLITNPGLLGLFPATDMESDRANVAVRRCRGLAGSGTTGQTMVANPNFSNLNTFYFCLFFRAPAGQQPLPWDFANSQPFGEFLYVVRNWDGNTAFGASMPDPTCSQYYTYYFAPGQARVANLYYTLYWSNNAPGQRIYRARSGQLVESDTSTNPY